MDTSARRNSRRTNPSRRSCKTKRRRPDQPVNAKAIEALHKAKAIRFGGPGGCRALRSRIFASIRFNRPVSPSRRCRKKLRLNTSGYRRLLRADARACMSLHDKQRKKRNARVDGSPKGCLNCALLTLGVRRSDMMRNARGSNTSPRTMSRVPTATNRNRLEYTHTSTSSTPS